MCRSYHLALTHPQSLSVVVFLLRLSYLKFLFYQFLQDVELHFSYINLYSYYICKLSLHIIRNISEINSFISGVNRTPSEYESVLCQPGRFR
jgi:hypothetical protein